MITFAFPRQYPAHSAPLLAGPIAPSMAMRAKNGLSVPPSFLPVFMPKKHLKILRKY
jgi:hypothetical protein